MQRFRKIQDIQKGYYLEPGYDGFLSVILPQAATNLILNPLMNDSNNDDKPDNWIIPDGGINPIAYSKIAGGPFWTHYFQYCWPGSGHITAKIDGTLEGVYTASVWVKSNDDDARFFLEIFYNNGIGVRKRSTEFTANKFWQQYSFTFTTDGTVATIPELDIIGNSISCLDVGAAQLEKGEYATTFISGYGGEGYSWLGIPFGSVSSREETVINGGRVVNLKQLGMQLTSISGLGLPDIDHSTTELAFAYGSLFNGATLAERDYDMEFKLYAVTLKDLLCSRNAVGKAIFSLNQPRTFIWQPLDCDIPICDEVRFSAVYKNGFSFNFDSFFGEEIKLSFTGYDIAMKQTINHTQDLTLEQSVTHIAIVGVDEEGNPKTLPTWTGISASISSVRGAVVSSYDNNLYVIVSEGTLAPFRGMVLRYNGTSWTKIAQGTTSNGAMTALHAHGRYLFVGISNSQTVTGQSGFTGTSGAGIARIDLSTNAVQNIGDIKVTTVLHANGSTSLTPRIFAFATDAKGNLFVGGAFVGFTDGVFDSTSKLIACYSSGRWYNVGIDLSASNGEIRALYYDDSNNRLYLGGDFRNASWGTVGVFSTFAYVDYTGSSPALGGTSVRTDFVLNATPAPAELNSITKYKNRIIVGGHFSSSYGYDQGLMDNIGYYDETANSGENVKGGIFPLGGRGSGWGISSTYAEDACTSISTPTQIECSVEPVEHVNVIDGVLYLAGKMQYYGIRSSIIVFHSLGEICGTAKYIATSENAEVGIMTSDQEFADVAANTLTQCYTTHIIKGSKKLGFARFYTSYIMAYTVPTVTSLFNYPTEIGVCQSDMPTEPFFIVYGPGRLSEITNQTTNASLYFDYTLSNSEILFIDLRGVTRVVSSIYGDVTYTLLSASTPASWKIVPGVNSVLIKFANNSTSSTTRAIISFTRNALAAETLCCECA